MESILRLLEYPVSILLLNGIPFSTDFWQDVQARLTHHGLESFSVSLFNHAGSLNELVSFVQKIVDEKNIDTIVAHGFAVPIALEFAKDYPIENLILSNGPLDNSALLNRLANLPSLAYHTFLHPIFALPFLSSSIAFRRLARYLSEESLSPSLSMSPTSVAAVPVKVVFNNKP